MGKANRKRKNRGGSSGGKGTSGGESVWDGTDHVMRKERQLEKKSKKLEQSATNSNNNNDEDDGGTNKEHVRIERRFQRTAKLTRDSKEKREEAKLRLNITKTQREVDKLRKRLQQWDDAEEKALIEKQREDERKARDPPKKRGRLGPESWKLKGAARPAWQVCEFDVRYECPHQKAHEQAHAKARRQRNLLALYKGKFGQLFNKDELSYPFRRQFLALLMQLGLLCMEAKKYKTARLAFLECLDLDGVTAPITSARCYLMRLYLQVNRPQSVTQLWNTKLSPSGDHETSPWVLFSVALVEYIRWKEFGESTRLEAEKALARAIQGNVLCAYYLAFATFFQKHMEYTDEVENVDEEEKGQLLEAIEYCCSEQMGMWMGTPGALEWVENAILRVLHGQKVANGTLSLLDLEWSVKLQEVEDQLKAQSGNCLAGGDEHPESEGESLNDGHGIKAISSSEQDTNESFGSDSDEGDEDEPTSEVDTMMYVGMYRTTMEMLYDSGALSRPPPMIVEDEEEDMDEGKGDEGVRKDKNAANATENGEEQNVDDDDSDERPPS